MEDSSVSAQSLASRMANLGNTDLLNMLRLLLTAWSIDSSEFGIDQQNKYIDMLLNQHEKKEDRQYSEDWRDNERDYNSAQSQLSRLMATGMSRDAAMKLIGAGGAGSGGSSAVPVTSTLPSGLGSSAIDYANMKINDRNSWANIVLQSFTTAANLVSAGFGINSSFAAAKNTMTSTKLLEQNSDAMMQSGSVMSTIQNAISQGYKPTSDDLSTLDNARSWLQSINATGSLGADIASAIQTLETNGSNNPFFAGAMNTAFRDYHDTANVKRMNDANYDNLQGQITLQGVQKDLLLKQTDELDSVIDKNLAEVMLIHQNAAKVQKEMQQIDALIALTDSQKNATDTETERLRQDIDMNQPKVDAYKQSAADLADGYRKEILSLCNKWSTMAEEDVMRSMAETIRNDAMAAQYLATFHNLSNSAMVGLHDANSALFDLCSVWRELGYSDIFACLADNREFFAVKHDDELKGNIVRTTSSWNEIMDSQDPASAFLELVQNPRPAPQQKRNRLQQMFDKLFR